MPAEPLIPTFDFMTHIVRPWESDIQITLWVLAMGVAVTVGCAILGCFLILRGKALLGDAISHALLAGLAGAFLLSGSRGVVFMLTGAIVAGLLTVVLIEAVHRHSRVKEDAAMAVVFSALFALGVVLITRFTSGVDLDAQCVLYGEIEGSWLRPETVWTMVIVTCLVIIGVVLTFKELEITSFDPVTATTIGIPAGLVHYGLMSAVSVTVVAGMEAVGAILVVTMLIAPGATAYLLTDNLKRMLLLASVCGAISAVCGYHLALWWDCSTAGAMSVVAVSLFVTALLASPTQGVVLRALRRAQLAANIARENMLSAVYTLQTPGTDRHSVPIRAITEKLRLLPATIDRTCRRLQRQGWLDRTDDKVVSLTHKGDDLARRIVRAHRLWEAYLVNQMGVAEDHAHPDAERIEHLLGERLLDQLDDLLGHPSLDPHGRIIPRKFEGIQTIMETPLSELREGDRARIKGVQSSASEEALQRIATMRVPIGAEITMASRSDTGDWVAVLSDGTTLIFDHTLADAVLVESLPVEPDGP